MSLVYDHSSVANISGHLLAVLAPDQRRSEYLLPFLEAWVISPNLGSPIELIDVFWTSYRPTPNRKGAGSVHHAQVRPCCPDVQVVLEPCHAVNVRIVPVP